MPNTMALDTVVMTLVMNSGQFSSIRPWMANNIPPRPIIRKVGKAMPSVSWVRIV